MEPQAPNPAPTTCWTDIMKQQPQKKQHPEPQSPTQIIESCRSTKGISIAVVDANAIIQGGERLAHFSDKFVSVADVISEVRDPTSRHRLSLLPFTVDTMEPSSDALRRVISFARETGDLQTLSDVDLKLIALTYTLEAQFHGTKHLRQHPPPIQVLNVRRLPEKDMPGWGNNVPNLEEWKALEGSVDNGANTNSRILPLKNLNLNIPDEDTVSLQDGSVEDGRENQTLVDEDAGQSLRPRKYLPKKREVKLEGKMMVANGIDASQGQYDDDDDAGDWHPAVSRSTHRRYLRRKARHEMRKASLKNEYQLDDDQNTEDQPAEETQMLHPPAKEINGAKGISEETVNTESTVGSEDISSILRHMRLEDDSLVAHQDAEEPGISCGELDASIRMGNASDDEASDGMMGNIELDQIENMRQANETVDTYIDHDGDSSEQSWMLRSLSDSSVACVTGDFAMQNIILQMGLRLLAPGGMQIRELCRWILKCHACKKITAEIGRIFCPKCGNGGTLRKVAVTVGENGIVLAAHRPRITLRGTRFSLPLPQGGRDAITKNPILREDQLPHKLLYPKPKKRTNKQEDNFLESSVIFSHRTEKKAPHKPPVRQALAVFSGKRNPNDNHYSRSMHKH